MPSINLLIFSCCDCLEHSDPLAFSDTNKIHCQSMAKYHSISLIFLTTSRNGNASFKSNTDSTSHLELPNVVNVSFTSGYAKLFLAILVFRCLKSVTTLLLLCLNKLKSPSFQNSQIT